MTHSEFEHIYKSYKYNVYLFSMKLLHGNHHDAEDITAYTFMKLWEAKPPLNHSMPITTWLFSVAHRKIIDLKRLKGRYYIPINDYTDVSDLHSLSLINAHLVTSEVTSYIQKLTPKYRRVFSLYFHKGYSTSEICLTLTANYQTIKNELCIVKKKLKIKMGQ